jgi:hypothetical protein
MTAVQPPPAGPPRPPAPMPGAPPAPPGTAPSPRPPVSRAADRRPSVRRRPPAPVSPGRRGIIPVPRTVAGRVRVLTGASVLLLAALVAVTAMAVGNARDGVRVIGHDAGPQVVATGNLYFHLTQMDAQLANALLIGNSSDLGMRRQDALNRFAQSRLAAGDALLRAAKLADEPIEERTARESLNALARYEQLAGQAVLLDQRAAHEAGPPPQEVITIYRQAANVMKLDLLPKAYNLTLDNGTLVRTTYESERRAVLAGQVWVLLLGLAALAVLVVLQLVLWRRFRRLLNPALAAVTLITLVLVLASTSMLAGQLDELREAKRDGFDSLLALSRARAISTSANADETRYLLDPELRDTYEQVYLSKSQSVLYRPGGTNIDTYNAAVQRDLGSSDLDVSRTRFLGLLGREADYTGLPGQPDAYREVLRAYREFQASDARVRSLARGGQSEAAIQARLGGAGGAGGSVSSDRAFADYDEAVRKLIAIHGQAFDNAVREGDNGTRGWDVALPVAGLVLIVLVIVGVRPRLAEYR